MTDTLAPSYSAISSVSAGMVAEKAAGNKRTKYSAILQTHDFIPIAFETLGPINAQASNFISQLGRRITMVTGDIRETQFLFQRLSIAIHRFHCLCLLDTFDPLSLDHDDLV